MTLTLPSPTAAIVVAALVYYIIPSVLEPVIWKEPFELPELRGKLAPNQALKAATHLCRDNCKSPESSAIDPSTGYIYSSLGDGRIVELSQSGEFKRNVFFSGGYLINVKESAAYRGVGLSGPGVEDLMNECHKEAVEDRLAWDKEKEKTCGRPLGIRFVNGYLYFLDGYHGLFQLNLRSAQVEHLVTPATPISVPAADQGKKIDPVVYRSPKLFNDLDVAYSSGLVYFSDSSYKNTRSENRKEVLDGAPRGRLFAYDLRKKTLTVLLCGLHFPNGVQFLKPQDTSNSALLLVDSARFRVLKVNVQDKNRPAGLLSSCREQGSLWEYLSEHYYKPQAQREQCSEADAKSSKTCPSSAATATATASNSYVTVFLDRAPGFVDNIRADSLYLKDSSKLKFFLGIGTKSTKPFSLLWLAYQLKLLRDALGKFLPMKFVEKLVPPYGLVVAVNPTGEIVGSLHDVGGKSIAWVSEAQRHPITGDLIFGSHSNDYLGKLAATDVPADW